MTKKLDCLKLINFVEKSTLFTSNKIRHKKILIAFSGGQDSSCLLIIFYILSKKWEFKLAVVYCHHCWEGSSQTRLAVFENLKMLNIPFYFIEAPNSQPMKPEEKARNWRYSCFYTILKKEKYDLLLTGHTLSDKVETVLFHLIRGTGIKGVFSLKEFQFLSALKKQEFKMTFLNWENQQSDPFKNLAFLLQVNATKTQKPFFHSDPLFHLYLEKLKVFQKKDKESSCIIFFKPTFFKQKNFFRKLKNRRSRLRSRRLDSRKNFVNLRKSQRSRGKISEIKSLLFSLVDKGALSLINKNFFKQNSQRAKERSQQTFFSLQVQKLIKKKQKEKKQREPSLPIQSELLPLSKMRLFISNRTLKEKEFLVFRPLIKVNRETLFLFSKKLNLPIEYDTSNKNLNITRNYIRKLIIPLLKKINPRLEQNIYKFSKKVEFYYECLGDLKCPSERFDVFHF
uniref:hypothetical protein RF62 n=1 Tax=Gayralia brasiliensis TaxID=1286870 RepID=UPI0024110B75|nr:hypothetical protein RF62 [Gayralia brasiliensis]YP_010733769.1 hypothetical protein RF62 [Monostroma nitidum]WEG92966.1 hypothetical protein RF62 [Gayralia brasiliensis]WEG93040.1 hypothetical protein RF62 [Monostroma nitidum]